MTTGYNELPILHRAGISYLERPGCGRAILLLHGIGSNAMSFFPVFDLFGNSEHLISWNAPGYLASRPLDKEWPTAADYAEALKAFVDGLGIRRMVLVGHSLGTLIASAFTAAYPDRVDCLVLSSSANGYGARQDGEMPSSVAARIDELRDRGTEAFARARSAKLIHRPEENRDLVDKVYAAMVQINPGGYQQALRMLATGNLAAMMPEVAVRPGFIIGLEDSVTPLDQTYQAARAWAAAHGSMPPVKEIAAAGHAVYLQRADEFAAAVQSLMGDGLQPDIGSSEQEKTRRVQ